MWDHSFDSPHPYKVIFLAVFQGGAAVVEIIGCADVRAEPLFFEEELAACVRASTCGFKIGVDHQVPGKKNQWEHEDQNAYWFRGILKYEGITQSYRIYC